MVFITRIGGSHQPGSHTRASLEELYRHKPYLYPALTTCIPCYILDYDYECYSVKKSKCYHTFSSSEIYYIVKTIQKIRKCIGDFGRMAKFNVKFVHQINPSNLHIIILVLML